MKEYKDLSNLEKQYFKEVCDKNFGTTNTFCETGEPLYFTKEAVMVLSKNV